MIVAFTGTRKGMTRAQKVTFERTLLALGAEKLVHGDCLGADQDAHEIAGLNWIPVHLRPCDIETQRGYAVGAKKIFPTERPLVRNHRIVDDGDVLIAAPSGFKHVLRSGTWTTVRYATRAGKRVTIIWPDGDTTDREGGERHEEI